MKSFLRFLLLNLLSLGLHAQDVGTIASKKPTQLVNDYAGVLSADQRLQLEANDAFQSSTGRLQRAAGCGTDSPQTALACLVPFVQLLQLCCLCFAGYTRACCFICSNCSSFVVKFTIDVGAIRTRAHLSAGHPSPWGAPRWAPKSRPAPSRSSSSTAAGRAVRSAASPARPTMPTGRRHLDNCRRPTYLTADVPRIECAEHGDSQAAAPAASM